MSCVNCDKNNPYECDCTCNLPKALNYEMSINLNFDFIPDTRLFLAGTMAGCQFIDHFYCYNFTPCDICQEYNGSYILTHDEVPIQYQDILESNTYCSDYPVWSYIGSLVKIQLFGNFSHKKCEQRVGSPANFDAYGQPRDLFYKYHKVLKIGLLPILERCSGYIPIRNPIIGLDPFQYYYYIMPAFTDFDFEGPNTFKFISGNPNINSIDTICDFTQDIVVTSYAV